MVEAEERVFLVTGALGAIGRAIGAELAKRPHSRVVLVSRHSERGDELARELRVEASSSRVSHEVCDLSRKEAIASFAQRFTGPLHVLVNNAATAPRDRQETPDGVEQQLATNVLGYFWMTQAFASRLAKSAQAASQKSRVVNVASYWAGDLDLSDLEMKRRTYDNDKAYRQSKQANRMLTRAFAEGLTANDITVNACHPGDVQSKLSRDLGFGGPEPASLGAATPVWLAVAPEIEGSTGGYYEQRQQVACPFMKDRAAVEQLYQICESY